MSLKKASIVIPTFNKLLRLKLVLKSLESQVTDDVEVIVVFDGCDTQVVQDFQKLKFTYEPIQVICPQNIGRACARNKGIEKASGDVVFFLDDDRIVSPDYIQEHLRMHEQGYPVVLGQRNQFFLSDRNIEEYYDNYTGLSSYCEEKGEVEEYAFGHGEMSPIRWMNFYTGNVSVDRQMLLDIHGFDEAFKTWGHEDLDLGIRLFISGAKFAYSNEARNYHMMHASNFVNKKEQCSKNMRYLIKKYHNHYFIAGILSLLYTKQSIFGVKISKEQLRKFEMVSSAS